MLSRSKAERDMARNHLVISGTGRTGTTFLVELLTNLGLQSGFKPEEIPLHWNKTARAGLEKDIRDDDCPYLVKSPHFCQYAEEILHRTDIIIDHVLIPLRDIHAAAESRRYVNERALAQRSPMQRWVQKISGPKGVSGGTPQNTADDDLELYLLKRVYGLVLALSDSAVPVTLLHYPRIIKDCAYLFEKLTPVLPSVTYDEFRPVFEKIARPDLAHSFNERDR
jgi:hypothetical protein